jgi:hypothetical protein
MEMGRERQMEKVQRALVATRHRTKDTIDPRDRPEEK